jgi:hypothetical protein
MWPRDNLESWQVTVRLIEEQPDDPYWSAYKFAARHLLSALEERSLNRAFRAGTSMHDIIFSTLDHHVLKDEPRVTLTISPDDASVKVAYSYSNVDFGAGALVSEETCPAEKSLPTVLSYLKRLWSETKPSEMVPGGLS